MADIDRNTIEHLRTWLSNRRQFNDSIDHYHSNAVIYPNEKLRALALPDLHLRRYTSFVCSPAKLEPQANQSRDTHLKQTLRGLSEFLAKLRSNRQPLELIEFLRLGGSEKCDKARAKFNVSESIELVQSCLALDWALDIQVNQLECVLVEDSWPPVQDLVSKICSLLFSSSPTRLVARSSHYSTCLMAAFLVDLLHEAGFSGTQLQLLVFEHQREATSASELGSSWLLSPKKNHQTPKQSLVAICFADSDTAQALGSTFCAFAREPMKQQNLILLMEEANYDTFLFHWENNSDKLMSALPSRDIKIDLNCIDVRLAQRTSKPCINVIKFRSLGDLQNLMSKLGKVTYIQLWSSNHIFARHVALKTLQSNQCEEFWLNQMRPSNIAGNRFSWQLIDYYRSSMKLHMDGVYTNVLYEYEDRVTNLRKRLNKFANSSDRVRIATLAYIHLISRFRSMKQGSVSVRESVSRLRKFHSSSTSSSLDIESESRLETVLKPIGMAILVIKSEQSIKSKSVLVEFIFKNFILGNGVMLVCPASILSLSFFNELLKLEKLPFDWIDPTSDRGLANLSPAERTDCTSWNSGDSESNSLIVRSQLKCPKHIFAVEFNQQELTSDKVDLLVLALGVKRKSIWYSAATSLHSDANDNDGD